MRNVKSFVAMMTLVFSANLANAQQQTTCLKDNVGNIYCPKQKPNTVDLSNIGLAGQDAYYKNREAQARAEALEAQARAQEAQTRAYEQQEQAASRSGSNTGKQIICLRGSGNTVICPDESGELRLYRGGN